MNQSPNKNYFTMPNEIFSLGLDASEIAVYAYLRCLESRSSYQCWPSYTTIGNAVGRAKNTVMQYVDALAEKGLIYTEPTSVLMKSGIKKNGKLRYTIRPIREAIEIFQDVYKRQLMDSMQRVLSYFREICSIPRRSGDESNVAQYLIETDVYKRQGWHTD